MHVGAPLPRQRPALVDLNVIPPEFRRRPPPLITAGLALVLFGCTLVLYGLFYVKRYTDYEVPAWQTRVVQLQREVQAATVAETAANEERQRLAAMQADRRALAERQIRWSDVLAAIADTPPGVAVASVSQAGYTVTLTGSAPDYPAAAEYLERLRASDLFLNMSIELAGEAGPPPTRTPALPSVPPPGPAAAGSPSPSVTPVAAPATATRQPTLAPAASPTPAPSATPSPAPTRTPTATPSRTSTPTAVPTPLYDYFVESKTQRPHTGGPADISYIRGRVLDPAGQLIPGLVFRISSEGSPPWSADGPQPDRRDGTFEFVVTRGKFSVQVLDGRSEVAVNLFTGTTNADALDWDVVFRKSPPVPTPSGPTGTPAPTSTSTPSPLPTPTAISPGTNIAGQAAVSVSSNGEEARAAVDGDTSTIWNSKGWPVQQILLDFGTGRAVDGVELVVSQTPSGPTAHELWVQDDAGSWLLLTTVQTTSKDGDTLAYRLSPVRVVQKVLVRSIRGPSFVAWREVRVYEQLAPPGGTNTPIVSATATRTPTPTTTRTPTPTPTGTATPTRTPTPTAIAPGPNVAGQAAPAASAGVLLAPRAIDGDTSTYWSAGAGSPQWLQLGFAEVRSITGVEVVLALVGPDGAPLVGGTYVEVALQMWSGANWVLKDEFAGSFRDGQVLAYAPVTASADAASAILVQVLRGPDPVAIREVRVYEAVALPAASATVTRTPSPSATATPSATSTPTPSTTSTPTPIAFGPNIAGQAALAATENVGEAGLVVDGDTGTLWRAPCCPPNPMIQLLFEHDRQISGVELVAGLVDASGASRPGQHSEVVELWLWIGPSPEDSILVRTFDQSVADGQVLAHRVSPAVSARGVFVRVLSGPNPVGWREVRVYEELGNPAPLTPTPTLTPTETSTPRPPGVQSDGTLLAAGPRGLGLGPGRAPQAAAAPPRQGPVTFVIVLEVRSGEGYE